MPSLKPMHIFCLALLASGSRAGAQNSAPSSHLDYNLSGRGNILINEVRVPGSTTPSTYYEALGWSGTGSGYGGIQQSNVRNFIFSIWDDAQHTAPIRKVYTGHGTITEGFGGEGTGLKSMNLKLNWQPDTWYALVTRCWPVGNHTYYGYWYRDGVSGKWRHLVTMDVAAANSLFEGGNDSFIEDWSNTGSDRRETNLRGGWKRLSNGTWQAATTGWYSVNTDDIASGGRSYNHRTHWDGGKKSDAGGQYYYMVAGGASTAPTTANPSTFTISRTETRPGYGPGVLISLAGEIAGSNRLICRWQADSLGLPQFSSTIELFDNPEYSGTPLGKSTKTEPDVYSDTLTLSGALAAGKTYYGRASIMDLLDNRSAYWPFTVKDGVVAGTVKPGVDFAFGLQWMPSRSLRISPGGAGAFSVFLSAVNGKSLYSQRAAGPSMDIPMQSLGLRDGNYLLKVESPQGVRSRIITYSR